jgi:hypothetical protein
LTNHQLGSAKTFVATTARRVVIGYYSLAASQVLYADAPSRLQKGVARHPVPAVLLARLAIDHEWQGKGLGPGLLKDAILRVLNAAEGIGVRALLVHAKDEKAKSFYFIYTTISSRYLLIRCTWRCCSVLSRLARKLHTAARGRNQTELAAKDRKEHIESNPVLCSLHCCTAGSSPVARILPNQILPQRGSEGAKINPLISGF